MKKITFVNMGNSFNGVKLKDKFFKELKDKYEAIFTENFNKIDTKSNGDEIIVNVAIAHHNSVICFSVQGEAYSQEEYIKIANESGLYGGRYCGVFGIYLHEQNEATGSLVLSNISRLILQA